MATENKVQLEKDVYLAYDGNCYYVRQFIGMKMNKDREEEQWKRLSGYGKDYEALKSYYVSHKKANLKYHDGKTLAQYVEEIRQLDDELTKKLSVLKIGKK